VNLDFKEDSGKTQYSMAENSELRMNIDAIELSCRGKVERIDRNELFSELLRMRCFHSRQLV